MDAGRNVCQRCCLQQRVASTTKRQSPVPGSHSVYPYFFHLPASLPRPQQRLSRRTSRNIAGAGCSAVAGLWILVVMMVDNLRKLCEWWDELMISGARPATRQALSPTKPLAALWHNPLCTCTQPGCCTGVSIGRVFTPDLPRSRFEQRGLPYLGERLHTHARGIARLQCAEPAAACPLQQTFIVECDTTGTDSWRQVAAVATSGSVRPPGQAPLHGWVNARVLAREKWRLVRWSS